MGLYDFSSTPIWMKYIDFETMRNNLSFVNVLCYVAIDTPLADKQSLLRKYLGLASTLFEQFLEESSSAKFQEKSKQLRELMVTNLNGNKDLFIEHITEVATKSEQNNKTRNAFEQGDLNSSSQWVKYTFYEQ